MNSLISQLQNVADTIKANIPLALVIIGSLWLILILNSLLRYRLNYLGIYPRHPLGLPGILFHPFLHGSFNHLFFNSIPLFVLLLFILTLNISTFIGVTLFVMLISGFAIWLFGRPGLHIGASGLIMGYFGYLLVFAWRHPSILSYLLAIISLYYFGSILLSIFPNEEKSSWEGHLFGLLAGIITAYTFHE